MKIKTYTVSRNEKNNPFIRMQGQWLNTIGFQIGDRIKVTVEEGKLTLESMGHSDRKIGVKNDRL